MIQRSIACSHADNYIETSPLPSWVIENGDRRIEQSKRSLLEEESRMGLRDGDNAEAEAELPANPSFLDDMKSCTDLASLHTWSATYKVDLRTYSWLAFQHLIDSKQDLEVLLESLDDSALNNPGNLDSILQWKAGQSLSPDDANVIGQWLKKTLSLGQRSEEQILLLAQFFLHISTVTSDERLKCGLIKSFLDGIQSSTVFGIQDVKPNVICILLDATARGKFSQSSCDLGHRLIKTLNHAQLKRTAHSIALFLRTDILNEASTANRYRDEVMPLLATTRSFKLLEDLPARFSCGIVMDASRELISHMRCFPESNIPLLKLLDQWWIHIRSSDTLSLVDQGSNRRELERMLAGKSLIVIATYLQHLDEFEIANFILRREIGPMLDLGDRARATTCFRQLWETQEDKTPYVSMIRAAYESLDLPDRTLQRIFRLLQMLQKSSAIISIIDRLRESNVRINESVIKNTLNTGMHWPGFRAEAIFGIYRELPLENFPQLAERMIGQGIRHPNEALKKYSARKTTTVPGYSMLSSDRSSSPSCQGPRSTIRARAQLLQRMAIAYSRAMHLPPRMAFRKVYRCYHIHMNEKLGRPKIGLIQALFRSGIVWPLEKGEWVSTQRITWILGLIGKYEGTDAAHQVDKAIYEWRGINIKRLRESKLRGERTQCGTREKPTEVIVRHRWDHQRRCVVKFLESLERPDT